MAKDNDCLTLQMSVALLARRNSLANKINNNAFESDLSTGGPAARLYRDIRYSEPFIENIFNFPTLAEAYRVAALDIAKQRRP